MLCEKCHKETATVHFAEVKEKKKVEIHLCSECAKDYQAYITSPTLSYSVSDLLGGLIQMVAAKSKVADNAACEHCGMTYQEFQIKGRLGCSHDYQIFRTRLEELLLRIQHAQKHTGKVPREFRARQTVDSLKQKMERAVREERYEDAAKIRDEIKKLHYDTA